MAFIPIAMAVMAVATTVMQGLAQKQAADQNAAMAQRQAQEAQVRADMNASAAASEASQRRRTAFERLGSAEAAYGASGLSLSGTPTDVLADMAGQLELDARMSEYKGQVAQWEGQNEATRYKAEAKFQRQQGESAMYVAGAKAGGSLLTSMSNR